MWQKISGLWPPPPTLALCFLSFRTRQGHINNASFFIFKFYSLLSFGSYLKLLFYVTIVYPFFCSYAIRTLQEFPLITSLYPMDHGCHNFYLDWVVG